jgi:lysophospholipase L1-like esterase
MRRPRFDVALLHVGGNDVLHATATPRLRAACQALFAELRSLARHTVWLGAANVGLSPTFLPPLSWWLTWQGRRATAVFRSSARRAVIDYVEFFAERCSDLFSSDVPRWYAADGIHPSSRSYRHCYEQVKRNTALASWLGRSERPSHHSSQVVQHTQATG